MPGSASHKKPLLAFLAVLVVTAAIVGKGLRADAIFGPAVTLTVPVVAAQTFAVALSELELRHEDRVQAAPHVTESLPTREQPAPPASQPTDATGDRQRVQRAAGTTSRPTPIRPTPIRLRSPSAEPPRERRRIASDAAPRDSSAVSRHRNPAPAQTNRSGRPFLSPGHSGRSKIMKDVPRLKPNLHARASKDRPPRDHHRSLPLHVAPPALNAHVK